MGKKLPVLSADRKRIEQWYDVTDKLTPCPAPAGLGLCSVAQLRLIVRDDDSFVGVKLDTNGAIDMIEGDSGVRAKLEKTIQMHVRVSYRSGKLKSGEEIVDIVFAGVRCQKCKKIKKPIEFVDLSDRDKWGIVCRECLDPKQEERVEF